MDFTNTLLQVVVGGLATGSIFGLVGLGLVLILNTTSVANFAQGEMGLLATFAAYTVIHSLDLQGVGGGLLAVAVAAGVAGLTGAAMDRLLVARLDGQPLMTVAVMTLGAFYVFHAIIELAWGPEPRVFPPLFGASVLTVGGAVFSAQQLSILVVAAGTTLGLAGWLRFSRSGIATRAIVQDPLGAALSGIPIRRLRTMMWSIGLALAGIAGVLIAPVVYLNENMMQEIVIQAFAAATLGGLNSLPGTFIGGLLLGVVHSFASVYVNGSLATAISLLVIVLVLIVRPSGLIGKSSVNRV